jgi:hypothetical protein
MQTSGVPDFSPHTRMFETDQHQAQQRSVPGCPALLDLYTSAIQAAA